MRIVRRLSVVVAALLLSGCWLQPGYGPERHNFNPFENHLTSENAATLQQIWSTPWDISGHPLVTPEAVVTGGPRSGSLTVRAASRTSGVPLWRRDLPMTQPAPLEIGAVLSVANDQVLTSRLAPAGMVIETLDLATGVTTNTATVPELFVPERAGVTSDLLAYRGLDLGTSSSHLVVRTRDALDLLWTSSTLAIEDASPLVIAGDRIFLVNDVAGEDPTVLGYVVDGCGEATCSPESTLLVPPPPPETGFATYDVRLLTVTDDGRLLMQRSWQDDRGINPGTDLIALASDGTLDWTLPLDAQKAPALLGVAVASDIVFAVGADGATSVGEATLFALSATSGEVAWRSDGVSVDAPIAAGELAYVGADVFAADGCGSASCARLATVELSGPGGIYGESVTAGTLFVNKAGSGLDGRLLAFAPAS